MLRSGGSTIIGYFRIHRWLFLIILETKLVPINGCTPVYSTWNKGICNFKVTKRYDQSQNKSNLQILCVHACMYHNRHSVKELEQASYGAFIITYMYRLTFLHYKAHCLGKLPVHMLKTVYSPRVVQQYNYTIVQVKWGHLTNQDSFKYIVSAWQITVYLAGCVSNTMSSHYDGYCFTTESSAYASLVTMTPTAGTKGHGSSTHTNTLHMASVWTQAAQSTPPLANHMYTFEGNMCCLWLTTNHPKEWLSA
jgi:hypothetical protein